MRSPHATASAPVVAGHPQAARILACARTCLGTAFHHQGRVPGTGLDCVGLVLWVGRTLALIDHEVTNYPRLPHPERLFAHARAAGLRRIPRERATGGDIACLAFARDPQHVGLLTEEARGMIHACARVGRVIEHRLDAHWRRRIVACFRYPSGD